MAEITIYHNGECAKSKGALELLQDSGVAFDVRWYIAEPLTKAELTILMEQLKMQPSQLVRKSEPAYKDNYEGKELNEEDWLDILAEEPVLIERPIVVSGGKAVIARPPELVTAFIK